MIKHFLSTEDWSQQDLNQLLADAGYLKDHPIQNHLAGKSIALLFLNPSMRTRTSFELGMQQLGGMAIVLQPGQDAWGIIVALSRWNNIQGRLLSVRQEQVSKNLIFAARVAITFCGTCWKGFTYRYRSFEN